MSRTWIQTRCTPTSVAHSPDGRILRGNLAYRPSGFPESGCCRSILPLILQGLAQAAPPGGTGPVEGLSGRDDLDARLGAWSPRARWANLQPEPFGPIVRPNAIDQALTDASAKGKRFRVRLDAGRFAPAWVLAMGSVQVVDPEGGGPPGSMGEFTVPKWWTSEYLAAYDDLIKKLGAIYDRDISAITLSAPMTIYAEPFIRQAASPTTRANLKAAGVQQDR